VLIGFRPAFEWLSFQGGSFSYILPVWGAALLRPYKMFSRARQIGLDICRATWMAGPGAHRGRDSMVLLFPLMLRGAGYQTKRCVSQRGSS
jgi:hypothetical protein